MSFGSSTRWHNHAGSPGWGLNSDCSWPGPQLGSRARSNQIYSTNGLSLGLMEKQKRKRDLPGNPVVKTQCFCCMGYRFHPCSGNQDPTSRGMDKKKREREKERERERRAPRMISGGNMTRITEGKGGNNREI